MLYPSLEEVKGYLRVDGSEDDGFLALCIHSAKEYLRDAGVRESSSARYKMAVMIYVSQQYDREQNDTMSRAFQSLVLQLRGSAPSGTGDESGSPVLLTEGADGDGI